MSSNAPPGRHTIKVSILQIDKLLDKTIGAQYFCELFVSTESEGYKVEKSTEYKTDKTEVETFKWDKPNEFSIDLPAKAEAIVVFLFAKKKGSKREEVGYLRINLDDITSNDKKWFVLHSTKKEQTLGAGLLYIDLKYGNKLGHAATAVGSVFKKLTNIVTDSGPSAKQKKQFKEERKKTVDTKIGLGYKSGTISLKFLYIPPGLKREGCLCVTVLSGANLDAKDVDGTSDPYVKMTLNNVTAVSQIIKSNLNPIFNYECQFVIPPNFELFTQLHIEVWDYDKVTNDDLIGTTDVILDEFIEVNNRSHTEWELVLPLLRREKPVVDKLDGTKEGNSYKKIGYKPKYPIALIPGLASSVLEVKEGDKYWQNERIWLSLAKINAGKVDHVTNKSNMKSSSEAKANKKKDKKGDYSIRKQKLLTQNKWVDHMCLSEKDNTSDPPGIKVRAMKGHQAISYLADGLAKSIAYVMGPLIENLMAFGYDEKNLVALPYDWRLPLPALETRDKYFTEVKEEIEKLYKNTGLPVVVVCHSMGNRVFQYFLNYTKKHFGGQSWIDKHIHTFYAVGAPFLGSPKILRSLVSGERMGLDFFLSTSEALKFARTLGSFPCLLPMGITKHYQPKIFTYVKKEELNVDNKEKNGSLVVKAKNYEWIGHNVTSILTLAGAERQLEVFKKTYQANSLYGGSEESEVILKAPPVKKMRHIYGVNLNTEKLYFYRFNKEKKRLDLDKTFDGAVEDFPGYKFLDGIGYECSDTPQQNAKKFTGFMKNCSGDATVPYESLNYCMNWKDDLDLEVIELEKAEHRDIVSTTMFFRLLIEYVAEKSM